VSALALRHVLVNHADPGPVAAPVVTFWFIYAVIAGIVRAGIRAHRRPAPHYWAGWDEQTAAFHTRAQQQQARQEQAKDRQERASQDQTDPPSSRPDPDSDATARALRAARLSRLRALAHLTVARGATLGEAISAQTKLAELLTRYGIEAREL
jgi:hypothetical protein